MIYEVSLKVKASVADDYRRWLEGHIDTILTLSGFIGAELYQADEDDTAFRHFVCRYQLRDRAALTAYLRNHAPQMRAEGERRFAGQFSVQRRVLQLINSFSAE